MRTLQLQLRDALLEHVRAQEAEGDGTLSGVADTRGGDTIYTVDAHAEEIIFRFCDEWAKDGPFGLIAEGVEGRGLQMFPGSADEADAQFLMIMDPIDGTRNIMYNKRSAWILSGIAPNLGEATTLADIEASVMTELPTTRHRLGDVLWAVRGGGAHREAHDLFTGAVVPLALRPSQAPTLAHGFASIAKFFPPAKGAIAAFEEELLARVAPDEGENPLVFDDEYISTGGQIYEILVGHDRFIADLRPVFFQVLNLPQKLVCHPYDICVELIAREAGVAITDENGQPLATRLDIREPVSWVGYANATLRERIEPELQEMLGTLKTG